MIPFKPEPLESLKKRFTEAIKQPYNVSEILKDPSKGASNKQQNVFDFESGIRIIVSREFLKGKEVIHFSASIDSRFYKKSVSPKKLLKEMEECFQKISNLTNTEPMQFIGLSEGKGVPNWILPFRVLN